MPCDATGRAHPRCWACLSPSSTRSAAAASSSRSSCRLDGRRWGRTTTSDVELSRCRCARRICCLRWSAGDIGMDSTLLGWITGLRWSDGIAGTDHEVIVGSSSAVCEPLCDLACCGCLTRAPAAAVCVLLRAREGPVERVLDGYIACGMCAGSGKLNIERCQRYFWNGECLWVLSGHRTSMRLYAC